MNNDVSITNETRRGKSPIEFVIPNEENQSTNDIFYINESIQVPQSMGDDVSITNETRRGKSPIEFVIPNEENQNTDDIFYINESIQVPQSMGDDVSINNEARIGKSPIEFVIPNEENQNTDDIFYIDELIQVPQSMGDDVSINNEARIGKSPIEFVIPNKGNQSTDDISCINDAEICYNATPNTLSLIIKPDNVTTDDKPIVVDQRGYLQLRLQDAIVELSNFYIIPEKIIISDNGLYQETVYVLKCYLYNKLDEKTIYISAYSLHDSKWVIEKLGLKYCVTAYPDAYKYLMMYLADKSVNLTTEFKYDLVGWKYIKNQYVYLHGNGAIGSNNETLKGSSDKKIEIDSSLNEYIAFEQSLSLLNLSDNLEKTLPLFLYAHLAVMKELFTLADVEPKFVLWCYGLTGSMKTSVCKIFFTLFNRKSSSGIVATFKDTPSAVEIKAFENKDSVLLVDDYHPTTSSTEKKEMELLASHVLRMYGDGITKSRATKTMGKQKEFPPRGLCVITGEDKLGGESTVARYIGIEVTTGDYKTDVLSFHQNNPLIFSTHMYHFIEWVSYNFDKIIPFIKENFDKLRKDNVNCFRHKRLIDTYAILQIIAQLIVEYSISIGYSNFNKINNNTLSEWNTILYNVIMLHENVNVEANPAIMYLTALDELLSSGKIILHSKEDIYTAKPNIVGFKDTDFYYLFPEIAFAQVRAFWKGQGLEFPVSNDQVNKALDELKVIKTTMEAGQTKRTVKATICKQTRKRYLTIDIKNMTKVLNNL